MEEVDYLPGVPPIRVIDLPKGFDGKDKLLLPIVLQAVSIAPKAQFLLFVSVYELEAPVIDIFKKTLTGRVYAVGPTIPYFDVNDKLNDQNTPDYIRWLDRQPEASVLYISQGSFLSVSTDQLNEIIAGVHASGIRFMWIARGETSHLKHENGLVIPWCDQLRVLCHSSVGAFWSHCGFSSTIEGAFSGVPMLTFPIVADQVPNSKMIVEDWQMGKRVKTKEGSLVTREEIINLIRSFMDRESKEGKEMRKQANEVKKICRQATTEGGSAQIEIDSFINDVLQSCNK